MDARPEAYTYINRVYTPKRNGTARGCTSRGVHTHKQGIHTEKGQYRHVDARPEANTRLHRVYTSKRAAKGTWMHVQRHTHTCTGRKHRKRQVQARGCMSRGKHSRSQGVHTEKGSYRYVDSRPEAYTHINRVYTLKRASTHLYALPEAHTHVHWMFTP